MIVDIDKCAMIRAETKEKLLEWHCWSCNRLLMKYTPDAQGTWQHKCKCGEMNTMVLKDGRAA